MNIKERKIMTELKLKNNIFVLVEKYILIEKSQQN